MHRLKWKDRDKDIINRAISILQIQNIMKLSF